MSADNRFKQFISFIKKKGIDLDDKTTKIIQDAINKIYLDIPVTSETALLKKEEPNMSNIISVLDGYITYSNCIEKIKDTFNSLRMPNFPEFVSENLAKFIIQSTLNISPCWKNGTGDLECSGKKFEVKCFTSTGPSSFGPEEKWDELFFLDATDYINKNFICYRVKMTHTEFKSVRVNSTQLFGEQCLQGRRPRLSFKQLNDQLPEGKIDVLFKGNINDILKN